MNGQQQRQQQQRWRKPSVPKIIPSVPQFYHDKGNDFVVKLQAHLTQGEQSLAGRNINFRFAGNPLQGNPYQTDPQGIAVTATKEIEIPKGMLDVEISAQLENTGIITTITKPVPWSKSGKKTNPEQEVASLEKEVKIIKLEKEKAEAIKAKAEASKEEEKPPKIPTDLKVYAHPEEPAKEYFISIEVWGDDKIGIPGVTLEIKDITNPDVTQRQQVVKTGDDGAYRFRVETNGPREIFVSVVGNPLDYTLDLPGPIGAEYLPPPKVPQAPRKVLKQGLWATMRWYRERVIEARERR